MFHAFALLIAAGVLLFGLVRDPGDTLRKGVIATFLFAPAWLSFQVKSLIFDLRTVAEGSALLLLVFLFAHVPLRRWTLSDTLAVLLWGGICFSEALVDDLRPLTPAELARFWLLPYLCGRAFFLNWRGDVDRSTPAVAAMIALAAGLCVVEALTKTNLVNRALGMRFGVLESGEGYRWGMKRAQGALMHPIYNGMMLTLMAPWAWSAFRSGWAAARKTKWLVAMPAVLGVAVFFCVSRGPQLAYLMTTGAVFFFAAPKWRAVTLAVAVVGGGGALVAKDAVMDRLKAAAGETQENVRTLIIDGEEVEYTGTAHRMLLFKVYGNALSRAGWFGYGGRMADIPVAEGDVGRFGSIDNHYVKHLIQYGWWGTLAFAGLGLSGVAAAARVAWRPQAPNAMFAAGLSGSILATGLLMNTVWFSPDYGCVWLFSIGMAANLAALRPPTAVRASLRPPRRPAAAHSSTAHSSTAGIAPPIPAPRRPAPRPTRRLRPARYDVPAERTPQ